ncbi:hypothetical protein [Azospirillum endophyticum]
MDLLSIPSDVLSQMIAVVEAVRFRVLAQTRRLSGSQHVPFARNPTALQSSCGRIDARRGASELIGE